MSGLQLVGVAAKRLLQSDGGNTGHFGFTHVGGIGAVAGKAGSGHDMSSRVGCVVVFFGDPSGGQDTS